MTKAVLFSKMGGNAQDLAAAPAQVHGRMISEREFVQMIRLERRRSERSGKPFVLILIDGCDFLQGTGDREVRVMAAAISGCTRETDVIGWYEQGVTVGLLFTEIGQADHATVTAIIQKTSAALQAALSPEEFGRLTIAFRVFPHREVKESDEDSHAALYPDLSTPHISRRFGRILKRTMDILGSLLALSLLLPILIVIAVLVKLTSEGPVLFCQKRLGQYGRLFSFPKFRSMYVDNDPRIHQEYVAKLITGEDVKQANGTYKLMDDPRVTRVGRFLRKTSLDELPQFVSVLCGDMSLVGPRPPLPYEYDRYRTWHRRRVLEIKPGLTGLWQVEGRSRTTFDEMVRMDLKYARMWSLWLDCKILLQTPKAMLSGQGAS
jgi:lipopolysaccharide/colanic/teichoic acid biosynthesis glycosyltransferase